MSEVASTAPVSVVATPAAPHLRWPRSRDMLVLLCWLIVQGLINLAIYPYLPQYDEPAHDKLARKLRAELCFYEVRRVAPFNALTAAPSEAANTAKSNWTLPYRLKRPATSGTEPFPLIIFLHGAGERGYDNLQQLQTLPWKLAQKQYRAGFTSFVVAPQCPSDTYWGDSEFCASLFMMIAQLLRDLPIVRTSRTYFTGIVIGGHSAYALAAAQSDLFAALVPVSGIGEIGNTPELPHVHTWVLHETEDSVVPIDATRQFINEMRFSGGSPKYSESSHTAHD